MSGIKSYTACFASLAVLAVLPAHAVECGDIITQDTVLTANVGPCPGDGLVVGRDGVTLDLNGHRITGTGVGAGVRLSFPNGNGPATIQGPGVIANFAAGISVPSINNVTIRYITFYANGTGVGISQSNTDLIANNVFRDGGEGIHLSQSRDVTIEENKITGNSGAGIFAQFTGLVSILDNTIDRNQVGITNGPEPGFMTIRGNTVSRNQEDGIVVTSCSIVAENHANRNGGSGIVTRGGPGAHACPIQENTANHNSVYGIAVLGGSGYRVTDNTARHNGIDLVDATSGNCWSDNSFKTSQPAVLPACQ